MKCIEACVGKVHSEMHRGMRRASMRQAHRCKGKYRVKCIDACAGNQRKMKGVKGQRCEASGQTKAESSAKDHETAEKQPLFLDRQKATIIWVCHWEMGLRWFLRIVVSL